MSAIRLGFLGTFLVLVSIRPVLAQADLSGTARIEQALLKLNNLGSVLMIAAHPDDENNPVLAYLGRGRHLRTGYLSATRGEGGQNLIGPEQGDLLGIIRTQELLAARRVDGGEQFFTRAIDFGFSKSAAEALDKWGREPILSDMVWVIRRFRPDVIVMTFSGTPRDGHGQHQASAILGREAFAAAGDPARFPEQLRWVQPWKARRALQALYIFGPDSEKFAQSIPNKLEIDPGQYDPILGRSYAEIGAISRSMHRCQAEGSPERKGSWKSYLAPVAGEPAAQDLMDGIDTTWNRLPGGGRVGELVGEAIRKLEPAHPDRIVPLLTEARARAASIDDPLARIKLSELDETIALCAGLWIDAQAEQYEVTPGASLGVAVNLLDRSPLPVKVESARLEGMWNENLAAPAGPLANNEVVKIECRRPVPADQLPTQPYWLVHPRQGDRYTVSDQQLIGLPEAPALLRVRVVARVGDAAIELVRPVHHRYVDRAQGERTRPLVVVPPVVVSVPEDVVLFPAGSPRRVQAAVKANVANVSGEVRLKVQPGWKVEPESRPFHVSAAGEQQELAFEVTPPAGESVGRLRAVAAFDGRQTASGMHVILYPHFPAQTLFPPAEGKLVRADVRVTARRVGYIMGAGDEMPDALRQLGCEVTLLTQSDLEQRDLSGFDAIVAGVRAYNVRPDVHANLPRLLDYVSKGGTYIVQYNVADNTLMQPIGPYPLTVARDRVTVEDAPVTFPDTGSPLLKTPNAITARDFEGWTQERGLYFAAQWDGRYRTVVESHDPGEKPLAGGLLWTRYGKGVFIFSGYSWFRQIPAGVPGAYRIFANLLSAR